MKEVEQLKEKIKKLSQFPHKKRKENYQSYYLRGEYVDGSRNTLYRMDQMSISNDLKGLSVLDIGCCLGAICCECHNRGASKIMGIDYEKDYIECAKELAKSNRFDINYVRGDITKTAPMISGINFNFDEPIDIVFALSLFKHVKGKLFTLLDGIRWKVCYLETNNVGKEGIKSQHAKEIIKYMNDRKWNWKVLTTTDDRSPRIVFKVVK